MEQQKQGPNQPIQCASGCGFYGNPVTENYCSKCYRDKQAQQKAQQQDQNIIKVEKSEELKPAESVATPEQPQEKEVQVQKDPTRCWSCKKKVGLLGFKCRCNYVFCSSHRHADQHACNFDYKAMQKAKLEAANPQVVKSKIEKI